MIDRRKHERLELGELAGQLILLPEEREIDFFPLNVSPRGLAVFTSEALSLGQKAVLEVDGKKIDLSVKWCQPSSENLAAFRCGFEVTDASIKLDQLVQQHLKNI